MWMNVGMKFIFMLVTTAAAESWDFQWPYGENNSCVCQEVEPLGDYYTSQSDCLRAFAADEYQWCFYEDQGITDSQCDGVVAIAEGMDNDSCRAMCTGLVTRDTPIDDFSKLCKFNFHADFGDEVATGWSSCYTNMVYGWSDYDPTNSIQTPPLRLFSNVESPVRCQRLCQAVDECVYWTWRAYADGGGEHTGFQNEPLTCILYDQLYIDGVLNTVMLESDAFTTSTPYCNFQAVDECLVEPFGGTPVHLFEPYSCLLCDCISKCAWKSPYHLSGPAFCLPEYRDECEYERPAWTSTLPPCEREEHTETTIDIATTTDVSLDPTTTIKLEGSATINELTDSGVTPESEAMTTPPPEEMTHTGTSTTSAMTTTPVPPPDVGTLTGTSTTSPHICGDCEPLEVIVEPRDV
eukprot:Protomagalhaensia_sp_Gyna_25__1729@NODE_1903_length_1430_cov_2599_107836_g1254_i1_p1_GENE_NODE_1903_length_1430_cov_2599_107836_g1254_i1NODE_1903_length_1430_cov_2599_107836_g1254_i1_p1_ORF_typecomplete_len434_score43_70PAN_4/PF14295_6/1_7e03PAN_4/PF14295_6/3_1e05PAN_4/PF14295_6/1_8e04PAN_4/PF14295_6/1_2e04PAN_1/PF00024_26/7_4e02PAN_1/PF00024_26/0_0039Mucin15/PF15672_5/6_8_NODE_1903_length_1430_cov_2599_107836_g1254_i1791302